MSGGLFSREGIDSTVVPVCLSSPEKPFMVLRNSTLASHKLEAATEHLAPSSSAPPLQALPDAGATGSPFS